MSFRLELAGMRAGRKSTEWWVCMKLGWELVHLIDTVETGFCTCGLGKRELQ